MLAVLCLILPNAEFLYPSPEQSIAKVSGFRVNVHSITLNAEVMYACAVRGVFLENSKFLQQVYVDDLSR